MKFSIDESRLLEFAKTVELAATNVLEGHHSSPRGSEGVEFHSSRPYAEGEDIRRVDWKRYASSDRFYLNRFEREEKTSWVIALDASESMRYGTKLKYASLWAGALIFLAKAWGDSWRLLPHWEFAFDEALESLAHEKVGLQKPNEWNFEVKSQERLVILSDFFWDFEARKHEWLEAASSVYFFQTLDPQEFDFSFNETTDFRDLESADKIILDPNSVRQAYQKELRLLQERLRSGIWGQSRVEFLRADPSRLSEDILRFFESL